jgi:hydroxyacylglutathione hydrolase
VQEISQVLLVAIAEPLCNNGGPLQTATTMLGFHSIPVTVFEQNATLIWCEQTREAAWVDPGGSPERLFEAARERGLELRQVLLTHGHLDHVGGARALADLAAVPIVGPGEADRFWLEQLPMQARMFGTEDVQPFLPDRWLTDGDQVRVGNQVLDVYECPGHTPGHVIFHHAPSHLALVGDVLFAGSIGRTDFPRGNHAELLHSITAKLWPLGDDTRFVPGHGPMSTFGQERQSNPFVGDRVLGQG